MKVAKVLVAIVLGVLVVIFAWGVLVSALGLVMGFLRGIVGLAFGVAVIGGLGWVILRLLGKKSLTGNKYETLP